MQIALIHLEIGTCCILFALIFYPRFLYLKESKAVHNCNYLIRLCTLLYVLLWILLISSPIPSNFNSLSFLELLLSILWFLHFLLIHYILLLKSLLFIFSSCISNFKSLEMSELYNNIFRCPFIKYLILHSLHKNLLLSLDLVKTDLFRLFLNTFEFFNWNLCIYY
jgi:hypothetical protein